VANSRKNPYIKILLWQKSRARFMSARAGGTFNWSKEIALQNLDQITVDTKRKAEVTTSTVKMHHALGRGKTFLSAVVAAVAWMSAIGQFKTLPHMRGETMMVSR
jgi:hypothetical protein